MQALGLLVLAVSTGLPTFAWGGKIKLERKYRSGDQATYETKIQSRATIHSDPPGLKSFLPPLPTELFTRQRNTVTVRAVHPDGAIDLEVRFDDFEFQSNLFDQLTGNLRDSVKQAQEDFSHRMVGQTLVAHYDREGRLVGFEGGEEVLERLDAPVREVVRYLLRVFLEQMGGKALCPDGRVKRGEEWNRKLDKPANDQFPFATHGEGTLRYVGKTKVLRVKAAMIDYHFNNSLKPDLETLRRIGPWAQLAELGLDVDLGIEGDGQGRALVALEDGRVVENRSNIHQTLRARVKGGPQASSATEPLTIVIEADTTLEVESSRRSGR